MKHSQITPAPASDLAQIIAPFVNARLSRKRDANGYVLPRTRFLDIYAPGVLHYDADVREIDDRGVTVFRLGSQAELIPWAKVQDARVRFDAGRPQAWEMGL